MYLGLKERRMSDYDDLSLVRFKRLLLTMRGRNGTDENYEALRHEVLL